MITAFGDIRHMKCPLLVMRRLAGLRRARPTRVVWPVGLVVLLTGCSGINATKSVSPLDFLLPGLHMKNDPPAPIIPEGTNSLVCYQEVPAGLGR